MNNSERIRRIQAQLDDDVTIAIIREKHNSEIMRIKSQLLADITMEMVKNDPWHDPEIVAGRARMIVGLLFEDKQTQTQQ